MHEKKLSPEPQIEDGCTVGNSKFGTYTAVGTGTRVLNSELGDYSYCDRYCDIANTIVGKFSNIASFVRLGPTDHPLHTATLHHFTYRASYYFDGVEDDPDFFAHRASRVSHIGHDTWIGHGVVVKPENTIGHGAVVASGAVVTKDVAPYEIVAGVPAKVVRRRHTPQIAERLIELAWWDWKHEDLQKNLEDFRKLSAEEFLEKHGG